MTRKSTRSRQKAGAKARPRAARATSPPEPEAAVELVTPEMAHNWLDGRIRNRNVRDPKVDEYVLDMDAGLWHVAAALVVNTDGKLIDGQHRLEAVILHGEPVLFNVVRNAVPEAMLVVDTGLKRTLANFLQMRDVSNASDIAVLIRTMWRWDHYETFQIQPAPGQKVPTRQQAMAYYDEHDEALDEAVGIARRYSAPTNIPRSVIGVLHILFGGIESEDESEFWRLVTDGAEGASAIVALRRRLQENYTKRDKMPSWYTAALVIKAWNFWRAGTEVGLLKFRPGGKKKERFPMPV